jgi:bifunctional oligoribonuclease and PAP phosphatase NrnA
MSIQKAIAFIRSHKSFLISSHTNMEGDALGSELGFYFLVKKLGKQATMVNEDGVPYGYEFLPALGKIRRFKERLNGLKFDCFVTVDCSDLKRTGEVYTLNVDHKPVLNIDHHISNSNFGQVNWVDPEASSASEMIYRLHKKMKVALDKNVALALYAGILTDTGSFRFSNTSSRTHEATAELLTYGIDVVAVYKDIYGSIPYSDLKLLTKILPNMKTALGGKIVWFEVSKQLLKKQKGIFFDLSETLLTFARTLKGLEVAVLFRENLGEGREVRVNFRSQGAIDVNKIANLFGGGGHKSASGCTIKGLSLTRVRKTVLNKIKGEFNSAKR